MIFIFLFNVALGQTYYPLVTSLIIVNSKNTIKITASCNQTSDIYYALYLINGIRPSFQQIKTRMDSQYTYEYYGFIQSATNLEKSFTIKLNSKYNIDIYCLTYDTTGIYSYLSYPQTKDLISTQDNGSKAMILKMYFNTQPTTDQVKNIICQAQYKYPLQASRILIGDWTKCTAQNTSTTNTSTVVLSKTYVKSSPYPVFLYFLEDFTTLIDVLPDDLTALGAQELAGILLSNSGLTSSSTTLIDSTSITLIPQVSFTLGFSQQTLTASISITNTDGVIAFGITKLGTTISVEEFFLDTSSNLIISDLTSIQQNVIISYSITGLNIGEDYIVNIVGLLYPQAESPHNGIIRRPILASRIKALDTQLIYMFLVLVIGICF